MKRVRKKEIYAVLLAGGKGTRLWPLSTERHSKTFVRVGRNKPLIAQTMERLAGFIPKKNIIFVVDRTQAALLKDSVKGIPGKNILVEPFGRSTASAAGYAAIGLDPDAVMVVLPTDAIIKEKKSFQRTMERAVRFAREKEHSLLCVGIKPKEATSAYGYVKLGARPEKHGIHAIERFIEKPEEALAARFLKKKRYVWNAGMFIFRAQSILEAMRRHTPALYRELQNIKKRRCSVKTAYARMKNVSIDYQIMEKAKDLYCVKADFSWRDLGSWVSLGEVLKSDTKGNISFGNVTAVDTHDSIIYNSEKQTLGVVGLKGMVVAHTGKGTLVCSKCNAQKVKELVAKLG